MCKLETNKGRPILAAPIVALTVVALSWGASANAALAPLTLDEAIARATHAAPQIAVAAAILDATKATAPSAGRLPDPEFVTGVIAG